MSDSELHLLTGAYAVDALDPDERRAFEAHLASCPACSQEVRELAATASRLATPTSARPAAELRATVLSAARATPQVASVRATREARRRRATRLVTVAAAVLAVALVSVGTWALSLSREVDQASQQASAVAAVLTAADATASSGAVTGGGRGTFVVSRSQGTAVFLASDLAQLGAGRTYQLWSIDASGTPHPAGLVRPGPEGTVATTIDAPLATTLKVGVSVEPAGGSSAPTTTPVLVVPVVA